MSAGPLDRLGFALARAFLSTVGRTADGVRLCYDEGLTAGTMLSYVYRNRPSGRFGIGRWIDAQFLSHEGWVAVRERRAALEALIDGAIAERRTAGERVALLDVASGPGGYVLDVLARAGGHDVTALCRDLDEKGLAEGRAAAASAGLANVRFERGDAFDEASLAALAPRPNIVVSSGFYDWIPSDDDVRRSIAMLARVLAPGGSFVVTNQCAHPNLEFTQAVFPSHTRAALAMRMRPADQVLAWIRDAGLEPVETRTTRGDFYTVTWARKPNGA